MTDPHAPPRARPRRSLAPLLFVVLLGAAGFGFYREWSANHEAAFSQDQRLRQLERDAQQLKDDAARMAAQDQTGLANLNTRFEALAAQTADLAGAVQSGRLRVQAASAELLLTAALQRVQIDRDPVAAARLLEHADQRLAAAGDARLASVRKALIEERVALLAVPVPDREGTALLLAALIRQSAQWPIESASVARFEPAPSDAPAAVVANTPEGWLQRGWTLARHALAAMFSLRRDDRSLRHALAPEQEGWVRQILLLKLEGARLALLRSDSASFRDLCLSAAALLAQDYRLADAGVRAAQADLQRLSRLNLEPPMPETGRALSLLRALLERSA